jgi:hypothetical protein
MITKKEIASVIIFSIILGFVFSIQDFQGLFLVSLGAVFLTILVNLIFKKMAAEYWDNEIEHSLWEGSRYWYAPHHKFKRQIPLGVIIPIIVKILSLGLLNWSAGLTFETTGKKYKAAKRHGVYAFSEVTEEQIALIAATGIFGNILLAIVAYFANAPIIMKTSIIYTFYNLIPISNLDGNKIFFGNLLVWNILAVLSLIGVLGLLVIV